MMGVSNGGAYREQAANPSTRRSPGALERWEWWESGKKKLALFREGAAALPQSPVAMGAGRVCGGVAIFRYFYKEGKNQIF